MASFDQLNASTVVKGRIKNVHFKGFAFATTSRGDVFIPNAVHEALGKPISGSIVKLKVKRGNKGFVASLPPVQSNVHWDEWQVGEGQVPIPDTMPCSQHPLSFSCFKCGSEIVTEGDIHKIKQGTLWTNYLCGTLTEGKTFHNKYKQVTGTTAHCAQCGLSIGTMYHDRYHDAEEEKPFPCVKLTITREHEDSNAVLNQLVLTSASRRAAEQTVSRLVRINVGLAAGDGLQLRITKHSFALAKQVEAEAKARLQAEAKATEELVARRAAQSMAQKASSAAEEGRARELKAEALARAEGKARLQAEAKWAAAADLLASGSRQWSCEVDSGVFQPYRSGVNDLIEAAYDPANPSLSSPVTWQERGFQYEVDWGRSVQVNLRTGCARLIRATTTLSGAGEKPWTTRGEQLPNGAERHAIKASGLLSSSEDTREQAEFNFAYAQMMARLGGGSSGGKLKVHQVDVIESPSVERSYAAKKASMPSSKELWVFHGTKAVDEIVTQGFKVGGVDAGVGVLNGAVHGHGVYTATNPMTPMEYDKDKQKVVILAKALEGVRGARGDDCWAPRDDWLVFKTGEQLLPKYVVYWS